MQNELSDYVLKVQEIWDMIEDTTSVEFNWENLMEAVEFIESLDHKEKHYKWIESVSYTHLTLPTNREV